MKRGTPKCQRGSLRSPLHTTFPNTVMLPDLHKVFPVRARAERRLMGKTFTFTSSPLPYGLITGQVADLTVNADAYSSDRVN